MEGIISSIADIKFNPNDYSKVCIWRKRSLVEYSNFRILGK